MHPTMKKRMVPILLAVATIEHEVPPHKHKQPPLLHHPFIHIILLAFPYDIIIYLATVSR
jgi:hypothetical protein